jgi:hypothetical protein
MNCCDKACEYKELNGGDGISDFYFCKYVGITMDSGDKRCLLDKFHDEILEELKILDKTKDDK